MINQVKYFVFKNGTEIIATIKSNDAKGFVLKDCFKLTIKQTANDKVGVGLIPYLPWVNETEITVKHEDLQHEPFNAAPDLETYYKQVTSNLILPQGSQILNG